MSPKPGYLQPHAHAHDENCALSHEHKHAHEHEHEHHHHHHHHGLLSRIFSPLVAPFRAFYHRYYVPYLEWLGNKLGGRAEAGRLAHVSHGIRISAFILGLVPVITFIALVGVTTFWTGGAALPLWAMLILGAGIALNTGGYMLGSAAKHLDISGYYDAELELHAANNELRPDQEKTVIPHGLDAPTDKLVMGAIRYGHDGVGGSGTGIGLVSTAEVVSGGLMGIEPVTGSVLFAITRALAAVACFGATGTYAHRNHVYANSIHQKTQEYYALEKMQNPMHQKIGNIINTVFDEQGLNINRSDKYTTWIEYRCYRAIDSVLKSDPDVNPQEIQSALSQALQPYLIIEKKSWWQKLGAFFSASNRETTKPVYRFSRDKLMHIEQSAAHPGPKSAVLDSMPVLESHLFDAVSATPVTIHAESAPNVQRPVACAAYSAAKVNVRHKSIHEAVADFVASYIYTEKDTSAILLAYHLKQALITNRLISVTKDQLYDVLQKDLVKFFSEEKSCNGKYILNQQALCECYPLIGNPHGNQFLVDYHTQKLAEAWSAKIQARVRSAQGLPASSGPMATRCQRRWERC